jgi:hypothetical protein
MSKKSRRSRLKHKKRSSRKPLAVKEAGQSRQVLPLSPKQASVTRSPVTTLEQATLHRNVLSEIKRSLTIAVVLFVLLIVLYFLLR